MEQKRNKPVIKGQILPVLRAVQLGLFFVAFFAFIGFYDSLTLAVSLKIAACVVGLVLLNSVVHLAKREEDTAASAFLLIGLGVLILLILAGGGMHSVSMGALTLVFICAAFYAPPKIYLLIFILTLLSTLLVGLNNIYGWVLISDKNGFGEKSRLRDWAAIMLLSGYLTWVIGKGIKNAFLKLIKETEEVAKAQTVIKKMASTDPLTGLLNRNAAKEEYQKISESLDSTAESIAFYFIDLDHFKSINDLFDHHAGNELLVTVSERLKSLVVNDKRTLIARLSADEFIFVRTVPDKVSSGIFAEKIREAISQPHNIFGAPAQITASIGVTKVKSACFDRAYKEADMAMNKVKDAKRNGYQFYSKELQREYMTSVNVIHGLQNAVEKELLELHYQPKVDLKTGAMTGVEALLRWTKDNHNNYGPGEFMPIIESTELIHDIGRWVIEEACRVCSQWHQQGHKISMAVNVSPMQLIEAGFYDIVKSALEESGLNPNYLEIELTEHLLIREKEQCDDQLKRLKSLGVCLSIDDFGTGYSNLGYLTQLRLDVLKLDRSFIVQMEHSKSTLAVIKAIISMARVLKLKVVAEGVETEQELQRLSAIGCDIGQGYLWSKPLEKAALFELLTKRKHQPSSEFNDFAPVG